VRSPVGLVGKKGSYTHQWRLTHPTRPARLSAVHPPSIQLLVVSRLDVGLCLLRSSMRREGISAYRACFLPPCGIITYSVASIIMRVSLVCGVVERERGGGLADEERGGRPSGSATGHLTRGSTDQAAML